MESLVYQREQVAAFDFRAVHPALRFGTASDRYAGWIGQVYPARYEADVTSRTRKLGGQTFEERTLPIASVEDYFQHFGVLELDFTFYRPLLDPDGKPSPNYFLLQQYATHAPDEARFLLKVPHTFFARKLRRGAGGQVRYDDNPDFLDADACARLFLEPAQALLADRLTGLVFEQEYQRVSESPDPMENIAELDAFFARLPQGAQAHLELRSPHLLIPPYFDWLESRGLGFVFSHWTWLPPLRNQWKLCGGRFPAANRQAVVRLLTPANMPYEKAYALAWPFDRPLPEIAQTPQARDMVLDVAALVFQAAEQQVYLSVIANNRAWGNAPSLAQAIAARVLDEVERRGG
jgi:uncharacterized protein YecE (DUF72 family)